MGSSDRIGSICWYRYFDQTQRTWVWRKGNLRAWSIATTDGSTEPVGIVEDEETLLCNVIDAGMICFASIHP